MRNKHRKQQRSEWKAYLIRIGAKRGRLHGLRMRRHRGVLVIKSDIDPEALARFREQWNAMISGVEGARWTTIVAVDTE